MRSIWMAALAASVLAFGPARAASPPQFTPTGQFITPDAAPGAMFQPLNPHVAADPNYTVGDAGAVALSPDGRTLLILTSGFNREYDPKGNLVPSLSQEFVFIFDVSGAAPVQLQALPVANSFLGLAWAPTGERFYVSGGVNDVVHEFVRGDQGFAPGRDLRLGHGSGVGLAVGPEAGGLAMSPDGRQLLVANFQNDSVSLIDLATGKLREQDLRPGVIDPAKSGAPGGSFPRAVAWTSPTRAYVASQRDREVIALDVSPSAISVASRIRMTGEPVAFAVRGERLYVALDNAERVAVIDQRSGRVLEQIRAAAPAGSAPELTRYGGAGVNGLALSADGKRLYVTEGGANDVAVIDLAASGAPRVAGLIPTGWYPTAIAVRPDGRQLYVVNGKSNTGPVPDNCRINLGIDPHHDDLCRGTNEYVWQREKAGFLTLPPPGPKALAELTGLVARNNRFEGLSRGGEGADTMALLRAHIHHVVYIVKENRTYDQVLGDLEVGDGDPKLAVFGRAMTPNQHALARQFVDLDAFFDSGESSNTGWDWTTAARTNDFTEREAPVNYAGRGLQYDQEGANRNLNMGYATEAERQVANPVAPADPNTLPGARDVAAPDGPDENEEGRGYIWDAALRAGLTLRNYGFFGDLTRYEPAAGRYQIPLEREPAKTGHQVMWVDKAALMPVTDPYFWGFNQALADYWRFKEWEREFDAGAVKGQMPNLTLLRLAHDHTGSFREALDGVNTVEAELADNDYAVGLVVEKIAHSPFAKDTLVFIIEDDAQDGPDHVDAHRSIAFIAGPYVKHGAVVSKRYTTVNMIKTIEMVLGLDPIGIHDALAAPMADVFDPAQADWTFTARVPAVLRTTQLPLPPPSQAEAACPARPPRSAAYWQAAMAGQDFSQEDRLDTPRFNQALWRGLKGDAPYPTRRDGKDLRENRPALLAGAGIAGCD